MKLRLLKYCVAEHSEAIEPQQAAKELQKHGAKM
jgi:hypothetical protein